MPNQHYIPTIMLILSNITAKLIKFYFWILFYLLNNLLNDGRASLFIFIYIYRNKGVGSISWIYIFTMDQYFLIIPIVEYRISSLRVSCIWGIWIVMVFICIFGLDGIGYFWMRFVFSKGRLRDISHFLWSCW